jgi:hypothetical protein
MWLELRIKTAYKSLAKNHLKDGKGNGRAGSGSSPTAGIKITGVEPHTA